MATLYKNWTIDFIPGNPNAYQAVALVNGQPMQSPATITDQATLVKWIDAFPNPGQVAQYIPPAQTFAPMLPTSTPAQIPYYGPSPATMQAQQQAQMLAARNAALTRQMLQLQATKAAAPSAAPVAAKPLWQQPIVIGIALAAVAGFFYFRSRTKA
jgi:hypothetical protein